MPYFFKSFLVIFGCAGSSLLHWLFSSCGEWGLHSIEMHGLLIAMAGSRAHGPQQLHFPGSTAQA